MLPATWPSTRIVCYTAASPFNLQTRTNNAPDRCRRAATTVLEGMTAGHRRLSVEDCSTRRVQPRLHSGRLLAWDNLKPRDTVRSITNLPSAKQKIAAAQRDYSSPAHDEVRRPVQG